MAETIEKRVYHYDRVTHALLGYSLADEDQRNPGQFLCPAFATFVEPPAEGVPAGHTLVFDEAGEQWAVAALDAESFPVPPGETPEQMQAALTASVQAHLDSVARGLGYDNIFTAVTYADEPAVPKFQAEGQALRAWRSQVWGRCYELLGEVLAGTRAVPSAAELIAELPEFDL